MTNIRHSPHRSSFGVNANLIVLVVWFGGFVLSLVEPIASLAFLVPVVIFFVERESALVKQHALQAMALYLFNIIAAGLMSLFPFLGLMFWIVALIELALVLAAAQKGWYYHEFRLPVIQPLVKLLQTILPK